MITDGAAASVDAITVPAVQTSPEIVVPASTAPTSDAALPTTASPPVASGADAAAATTPLAPESIPSSSPLAAPTAPENPVDSALSSPSSPPVDAPVDTGSVPSPKEIGAALSTPASSPPAKADTSPEPEVTTPSAAPEAMAISPAQDMAFLQDIGGPNGVITLDIDAKGREADIADPLQLKEAVALTLENNFEAKAAQSKTKTAHWEKLGSYSQYVPSVEMNVSGGQSVRSQLHTMTLTVTA